MNKLFKNTLIDIGDGKTIRKDGEGYLFNDSVTVKKISYDEALALLCTV